MLEDGQEIAVKRLSKYSSQGFDEFRNEVICIAKLQHRNLGTRSSGDVGVFVFVRISVFVASEKRLLVYQTQSKILDWPKRFSIINGIARGLLYLHQDSRLRVIHRDIKASNVLLDSAMNPKVSDFGLARRFGGNQTEANTNRVVGTYGYMSPEYAGDGLFSVKSDVFSFGVLVLEIAWMLYKEGRSLELLDANLGSSCNESEVLQSINVGLLCVQQCPEDRPSMSSVVLMLGHDGALPESKEPGFFINENGLHFDDAHLPSNHGAISANEMTITLFDSVTLSTPTPSPQQHHTTQREEFSKLGNCINLAVPAIRVSPGISVNDIGFSTLQMHHKSQSYEKNPHPPSMKGVNALVFLVSWFSVLMMSNGADTINSTVPLADGKTIISSGGTFELGFFSPGTSTNRYLGIWYKKISSDLNVVWVANREAPINDTSGVLKVSEEGILTVLNGTNGVVWSSNSSSSVPNPVAQLLESGNLVVRNSNDDNPDNYMWQTFDYPSHTLLPGMKLGRNLVTGLDRYLTSWKTSDDPARGAYKYLLDPRGYPQIVLMNGDKEIYGTGPWTGLRFSGSQGLKPNSIYTYGLVYNQVEVYYGFQLINSSVYSRLVLNPDGVVQRLTWNYRTGEWNVYLSMPVDNCDIYGLCQGFGSCNIGNSPVCGCLDKFVPKYPRDWENADWSNGCVRETPLVTSDCQRGDGFLKYPGKKLPDTRNSSYNGSLTLDDCHKVCLENCSCMAYANSDSRNGGSGCLLWFGELFDVRDLTENGQDLYIRVAASEISMILSPNPQIMHLFLRHSG
ncbi:hypothetical protein RJ640_000946 [Escallonia rubra]|uniref:non-specific serine/threonine protein kinase n=1 Tax=Escallonia rubra TaxID=112253 RepID=A0AA88RI04_9ASTE|nr:hypothetical protein RJ640_000946 [Escallonia rubra]